MAEATDTDGDGLPNSVEDAKALDLDCDGVNDFSLPEGVSSLHKDVLIEIDVMNGAVPYSTAEFALIKEAFAAAPVGAGGLDNPDGLPGINVWFDAPNGDFAGTGGGQIISAPNISKTRDGRFKTLMESTFQTGKSRYFRYGLKARRADQDPTLGEDGAGAGTCQDNLDNGMLGDGADGDDSDCLIDPVLKEDGGGVGSCTDGIDNITDLDGADMLDSECAGVVSLPREDGGGVGSCFDGIDNAADGFDRFDTDCLTPGGTYNPTQVEDGDTTALNTCSDGIDNAANGDESVDPDCAAIPVE